MDYIIVSTSRCKYQAWQLKLLYWSMKKVKQPGKLILLMSADEAHKHEKLEFKFDEGVELIDLPDWAGEWKRKHDDWWGGIPNKYESFNWIATEYPFKDTDTLLFLDPDMIFIDQVGFEPEDNEIIGQKWMKYSPIPGWPKYNSFKEAFMYPFVLRYSTLKKISVDFKDFCYRVRKEQKKWESDMWALDYATKENKVSVQYIENFGRCTVWQKNGDQTKSPIIHFPNVVNSAAEEKLFFKQDYTFKPKQNIEIHRARNWIDRQLLINIDQERTDYIYHLKWNFSSIFKFYTGKAGYIYIQPWPGGFNNIRMSLELGVCLAYLTNRTIVLPSNYQMYLLEGQSEFADFFDLDRLGVHAMDFESFCKSKKIDPKEGKLRAISKVVKYDAVASVINFEKVPIPKNFLKGRKEIRSEDYFDDSEVIFMDKNLLGSFEQSIYSSYSTELKKLVAKHVVYRSDIFDLAWRFINFIGDQKYYAIHIRRNDFQYKHLFIPCEKIVEHLLNIVPKHSKLYIATDHKDKSFFKPLTEHYEIVFYDEIAAQLDLEDFNVNWIPIIEQFVCTRAVKFVGMDLSTLSSYIFRMRGYMSDIKDKKYYLNGLPLRPIDQCDFIQDKKFRANWSREYKSIWQFNSPSIFVSIAGFCDTQLVPTIQNLLAEATNTSRVTIGVHLQDTPEQLEKLKSYDFPNLTIIFTEHKKSKGVVWARNRIKRELFDREDYFLQVDSHSRFKKNWDNILINQYLSVEEPKVVLTTYPNHYEVSDDTKDYLKLQRNSPLKIKKFLSDRPDDNRLRPENLRPLKDYSIQPTRWCAAGFVFAPGVWVKDVVFPDDIKFNGEEDLMTHISFLKGYNLRLTSEATIWHNYNYKNEKTGLRYKKFNENEIHDDSKMIINTFLFSNSYERSVEALETFLNFKFKPQPNHWSIYISIASYLDPEIRATILDCIGKAKYPKQLHFGICLQYDDQPKTNATCLDDLQGQFQLQIDKHDFRQSKGMGWARNKAQQFYNKETYSLQIDAHTRFIKDWDTLLIRNYGMLKQSGTKKPILSYRPPAYLRDEKNGTDYNFNFLNLLDTLNVPKITDVTEDNCLEYVPYNEQKTNFKNIPVPVLDGSFIFTTGLWLTEVAYDPDYYYLGEEVSLSLRSFTFGYDFFLPKQIVAWHRKNSDDNKKHFNTHPQEVVAQIHHKSIEKLGQLIDGKTNGSFGLGKVRNLKQFMNFSGVDFINKTIIKPAARKKTEELPISNLLRLIPTYIPASAGAFDNPIVILKGAQQIPTALRELGELYSPAIEAISAVDFNNEKKIAKSLQQIFNEFGTDKSIMHNYHFIYGQVLANLGATKKLNVLEIGIGSKDPKVISNMSANGTPGASLKAFKKILPQGNIYGADVDRKTLFTEERIKTAWVNQMVPESFASMNTEFGNIKYDLIIDDGLHSVAANLNTLLFGLSAINEKGWIVIEDIGQHAMVFWQTVNRLLPETTFNKWLVRCVSGCYVFVLEKRGR